MQHTPGGEDRGAARAEQRRRLADARAALAAATQAPESTAPAVPSRGRRTPPAEPDGAVEPAGGAEGNRPAQRERDGARDPHAFARSIVLRQLSMAPRSRAQLEEKLAQRDCPPDVARSVLDRLEQVGLVDDRAFADSVVRSKQVHRGLARAALARDLRKAGVAPDVVDESLGPVDAEDERARAVELVTKRVRAMTGLPRETQTRRLAAMLARKGYGAEVSLSVVRQVLDGLQEHQRD